VIPFSRLGKDGPVEFPFGHTRPDVALPFFDGSRIILSQFSYFHSLTVDDTGLFVSEMFKNPSAYKGSILRSGDYRTFPQLAEVCTHLSPSLKVAFARFSPK